MTGPARRALTWSYGGGTQSVGIAVLIARGKLPKPEWIGIADTARESAETWEYTERWIRPMLASIGLTIEIVSHDFATVDLYGHKGDLLIPAFTETGKLETFCSTEWKKRVIQRRLRQLGFGPGQPVTTWIGISLDEIGRCKPSGVEWQHYDWPLLWHKPALRRRDCIELAQSAGLPEPPKSACWHCPFRTNAEWRRQKEHYPEDHKKACALDEEIRARDRHNAVWIHRSRVPLGQADLSDPDDPVSSLFGEVTGCDSGHCWV